MLLTLHSFSGSVPVFTLSKSSPPQFRTCLLLPSLRSVSGTGPERRGSSRKLRFGLSPSLVGWRWKESKFSTITFFFYAHLGYICFDYNYWGTLKNFKTGILIKTGTLIPAALAHILLFSPFPHSSSQYSAASSPPIPIQTSNKGIWISIINETLEFADLQITLATLIFELKEDRED